MWMGECWRTQLSFIQKPRIKSNFTGVGKSFTDLVGGSDLAVSISALAKFSKDREAPSVFVVGGILSWSSSAS